jgi:hypothetical protein
MYFLLAEFIRAAAPKNRCLGKSVISGAIFLFALPLCAELSQPLFQAFGNLCFDPMIKIDVTSDHYLGGELLCVEAVAESFGVNKITAMR